MCFIDISLKLEPRARKPEQPKAWSPNGVHYEKICSLLVAISLRYRHNSRLQNDDIGTGPPQNHGPLGLVWFPSTLPVTQIMDLASPLLQGLRE